MYILLFCAIYLFIGGLILGAVSRIDRPLDPDDEMGAMFCLVFFWPLAFMCGIVYVGYKIVMLGKK